MHNFIIDLICLELNWIENDRQHEFHVVAVQSFCSIRWWIIFSMFRNSIARNCISCHTLLIHLLENGILISLQDMWWILQIDPKINSEFYIYIHFQLHHINYSILMARSWEYKFHIVWPFLFSWKSAWWWWCTFAANRKDNNECVRLLNQSHLTIAIRMMMKPNNRLILCIIIYHSVYKTYKSTYENDHDLVIVWI